MQAKVAFACPSYAGGICMHIIMQAAFACLRVASRMVASLTFSLRFSQHCQSSLFIGHNNITYLHSGCTSWISMAEHAIHSQEQLANAGSWLRAIHPALAINAGLTNDASRVCTESSVTKKNYNSASDSLKFLPNSPEVQRPINLLKMENEVMPIFWSQCAFSVYGIPCCFSGCCKLWFV